MRQRLYRIIFEAETTGGRLFDVVLLLAIVASISAVMLESVDEIGARFGAELLVIEWCFTILFTLEYLLRIWASPRPLRYVFSFFGLVDLVSILPTFLSLFIKGSQALTVIRSIRLLRVFRILKLGRFLGEGEILLRALSAARFKVTVFVGSVLSGVLILGTAMYMIEGRGNGFESIPDGMYWAIVTLTTVGYGDVVPTTPLGKLVASAIMILGYGVIAVPTGIVSAEIAAATRTHVNTRHCAACQLEGHALDAQFCRKCGSPLA
jgi:voltage-gated potassium channel